MVKDSDIITGKFNLIDDTKGVFDRCVRNKTTGKFIKMNDIIDYKIILFNKLQNFDVYNLDVIEQLTNNKNTFNFNFNSFINDFKQYNILLINQSIINNIINHELCSNNYELFINKHITINKCKIATYILPKEIQGAYFINLDDDNNVISYKKIIP